MKNIDTDLSTAPSIKLEYITKQAKSLIDNRIIKEQNRDRSYSNSNIKLSKEKFDEKLQLDWIKDTKRLEDIIQKGKTFLKECFIKQRDESTNIRKDFINIVSKNTELIQEGINPKTKFNLWIDNIDDLDNLSERLKKIHLQENNYSPNNKNLSEDMLLEKRVKDSKETKINMINIYNKNHKLKEEIKFWKEDKDTIGVYSKKFNNIVNTFNNYEKKTITTLKKITNCDLSIEGDNKYEQQTNLLEQLCRNEKYRIKHLIENEQFLHPSQPINTALYPELNSKINIAHQTLNKLVTRTTDIAYILGIKYEYIQTMKLYSNKNNISENIKNLINIEPPKTEEILDFHQVEKPPIEQEILGNDFVFDDYL